MRNADIVIVGGGMVGLALAALLAECNCQIKIIEKCQQRQPTGEVSHRVSAINLASQQMLQSVGAWQRISPDRLSPYSQMFVKEKDSFAQIHFDTQDTLIKQLNLEQLGFIIENQQIQWALWQQVSQQHNVEILQAVPQRLGVSESGAFLTLDNGEILTAKLVVGADGANSWVRSQSHIPLISQDYQHTALVCNVRTDESHQQTARQIFAPDSILAFLPLVDEHLCSIVWSLPPEKAEFLQAVEKKVFNQELSIAFDNQLGFCERQGECSIYPLTARYASDFAKSRVVLVGDAAHTIHPLAGLGVNLGFADVMALAKVLEKLLKQGDDIGEYRFLRHFERERKLKAVKVLATMKGVKELFQGDDPFKKLLRGIGVSVADRTPLLKRFFIGQAMNL